MATAAEANLLQRQPRTEGGSTALQSECMARDECTCKRDGLLAGKHIETRIRCLARWLWPVGCQPDGDLPVLSSLGKSHEVTSMPSTTLCRKRCAGQPGLVPRDIKGVDSIFYLIAPSHMHSSVVVSPSHHPRPIQQKPCLLVSVHCSYQLVCLNMSPQQATLSLHPTADPTPLLYPRPSRGLSSCAPQLLPAGTHPVMLAFDEEVRPVHVMYCTFAPLQSICNLRRVGNGIAPQSVPRVDVRLRRQSVSALPEKFSCRMPAS